MRGKRITVLFAMLALVVALCPGVAFAVEDDMLAGSHQLQEGALPSDLGDGGYQVRLDGTWGDEGWLHFYVDGKEDTYLPEVALYYGDEQVDASLYSLDCQINWYDEEKGGEQYADVSLPLRIYNVNDGEGEYSGIGATYVITAVPAEGSGFKGKTQPTNATVSDKSTFEYHAKRVFIEGGHEAFLVPSWHDDFIVVPGEGKGVRVEDSAINSNGDEIDAQFYTVTYYNREPGPYGMNARDRDIWPRENPLPGFPTEEGTYFAVVEGKTPYFGETLINFDIDANYVDAQVALERIGDETPLFSDGTAQYKVDAKCSKGVEDTDWEVRAAIGLQGTFDDATHSFDPAFDNGECVYDAATHTITLNGGKILETTGGESFLVLRAWIVDKASGDVLTVMDEVRWLEFREAFVDYENDREWGCGLLPEWEGTVEGTYTAYVENAEHPDGDEVDYKVTNVEIVAQDPAEDGKQVIELAKDGDGWHYKALNYGEATLKVTYTDLEGAPQSYEFNVWVSTDVYEVNLTAKGDAERYHPGESVVVTAEAVHHSIEGDVPINDETYQWAIEDGSEFATVKQNATDPAKATVTFNALDPDQEEIWESVCVSVRLFDGVDAEGNPNECAYSDQWLRVEQCAEDDHEWVKGPSEPATCAAAGKRQWVCENCGLLRVEEIPALGHEAVEDAAIAATCTTAGKTAGSHCSRCGEVIVEQKEIPALGHTWGEATYEWSDDDSAVTATHVCKRDATHIESETAMTTATEDAAKNEIVYEASFANPAFAKQTKVVENPPAAKQAQSMKVTASAKTVKAKKLKKKAQTIAPVKVSGAQGAVSYKMAKVNAKSKKALKLNASNGKITIKKGTKKGNYSMQVTVTAAGDERYLPASQTVTVKAKVK